MAGIAIAAAKSSAERVVGSLFDKLLGELSLLSGVRGEIKFIVAELEMMTAFLKGAEKKQSTNEAAHAWVTQVKHLAYAFEDCMDEFSLHLGRVRDNESFLEATWRRLRSLPSLPARRRIAKQIRSIKAEVEEVSSRRSRFGLTSIYEAPRLDIVITKHDPRLAALYVEGSQLVGIDGPRDELIGMLLDEGQQDNEKLNFLFFWRKRQPKPSNPKLNLIAVVGPGGMGKTTVARKVYESSKVEGAFACRAWITVSQEYSIEVLLRDMCKQLLASPPSDEDLDKMKWDQLVAKLKDHLKEKRYIVVLDDIWKIDAWRGLQPALPENDHGSRVMLTTRSEEVAEASVSQFPHGHIHKHQKLDEDQAFTLFCKRVFFDDPCPVDLKDPSLEILKKCDGLPLAIVSIAGVLASKPKKTSEEWKKILKHMDSEMESNPELEEMKQVLSYSYNDLPYNVQRCFLYLSKFPEDSLIRRKRIQRLWIVEGLVQTHRNLRPEEMAESYFNLLVKRGMILPSVFDCYGKVKSFRVHDMMLETIVSKSMEDHFMTLLGKNSGWTPQDVIRRLSIHTECNLEDLNLSHLRSLSIFVDGTPSFLSPSLQMVRVLDLDDCRSLENEHLETVTELLHLKYLSLRKAYYVYSLPKSMGNLRFLETLELRGPRLMELPKGIGKLQRLRRLLVRSVKFHPVEIPTTIGRLINLQELSFIEVNNKDLAEKLQNLTRVRKLGLYVPSAAITMEISKFLDALSSSLRSLYIVCEYTISSSILNKLTSPPLLLESLKIDGGGRLPCWSRSLGSLVKLHLLGCEINNDAVNALGALPKLIELKLCFNTYTEESWKVGAAGFPSLKLLVLEYLESLNTLNFERGAMCDLESLYVSSGYRSETLSISGIANLLKLRELNLEYLSRANFSEINKEINQHPNQGRLKISTRIREDPEEFVEDPEEFVDAPEEFPEELVDAHEESEGSDQE